MINVQANSINSYIRLETIEWNTIGNRTNVANIQYLTSKYVSYKNLGFRRNWAKANKNVSVVKKKRKRLTDTNHRRVSLQGKKNRKLITFARRNQIISRFSDIGECEMHHGSSMSTTRQWSLS